MPLTAKNEHDVAHFLCFKLDLSKQQAKNCYTFAIIDIFSTFVLYIERIVVIKHLERDEKTSTRDADSFHSVFIHHSCDGL